MRHEDFLKELRQDPEYVAAEEELRPLIEIANAVLRLRLAKGWSQSELARRAGTKQANISKLENGMANPTLSFLRKVAQALETDLIVRLGPEQPTVGFPENAYIPNKSEALWDGARPQNAASTYWINPTPAVWPLTRPDQYETA